VAGVGLRAGATVTVRALSGEGRPGRPRRVSLAPEPSVRVLSATQKAVVVRCISAAPGVCRVTAMSRGREIGSGSARLAYGKAGLLRARIAAKNATRRVTLFIDVPGEGRHTRRVRLGSASG
jgi:hypothetical protein